MFIKIVNIFLSVLLPLSVILINNTATISYLDIYFTLKVSLIFFVCALIPLFFSKIRKSKYDIFFTIFIFIVILISLATINFFSFTYKQTILIWLISLIISFFTTYFNIIKNSFLIFIYLIVFTSSSLSYFIFSNISKPSNESFNIKKEDVFYDYEKKIYLKNNHNFFFVVFDGFPRMKNLEKIGYDTSKFKKLFQKYDLFLFDNTNSSYLDTQKSISSTMNLSLIKDDVKLDKKYFYKFIQNSVLLDIFKSNRYIINWFPSDLTLSNCPTEKNINCYPGKHKIDIFNKEIVKFYFQILLIQPYWVEKINLFYVNKIKKKDKILFNLDIVTDFVKNNKNLNKQFVFAHIMSPHPPYILNSKCNLQKFGLKYKLHDEKSFLNQIDCIYLQLDSFFKEIKENMPNSNLFIHSDHGTTLIDTTVLHGKENYENFVLINKSLLCNYKNINKKVNVEILKNIINCI